MRTRAVRQWLLLAALVALLPGAAWAQNGRISGTVVGADGRGIEGAQISLEGTRLGSLSGSGGAFRLDDVPAGSYTLRVTHLGFRPAELPPVRVGAGSEARVTVELSTEAVRLGGVVVSAARRPQRITEAPATITRIDPTVLDNTAGNNWTAALKQVKGLDFIQVGMTSVAVNARGFNSSFNNRMLMMEDGRIAVLPENGLPVGQFTAIPKVDLAGIEVLVGPGAALYGADASSGVITLATKDPRQFPGTTVEVTGGNREYKNVQARHAGVFGNLGYKVTGEWQDAQDWENFLTYNIAVAPGNVVPMRENDLGENSIDWRSRVIRGSGTLAYYLGNSRLEFSAGASETDGVGQTNVGRNQLRGWQYNFAQARFTTPNWFFNLYRTQSQSGESFAINRYADALARNPTLSPDSLRKLSDWPSDGRMYAAEVQNNFSLPALLNSQVVWGAQYRRDVVSSDRQWLSDRLTGQDIEIGQVGVYGQVETPIIPALNLVMAARYDDHENYEAQFSPKVGLVFKPTEDQALRITYNRAFKSPTTLQTNFHIPDWTAVIAIFGNREGFTVRNNDAGTGDETIYTPLVPEENVTWEAGYKGVLANRLFVDVAGYYSNYENFLSPLVIIANPFAVTSGTPTPTFAYNAQGELIRNPAGLTPVTLTYFNLGKARIYGTDAGINYFVTPKISLNSTVSVLRVDTVEVPAGREEATSINAPNTKWTLGANFNEIGRLAEGFFFGGLTARHVNSYYFRSGINMGMIPTFSTLDLTAGYRSPRWNTSFNVGVSNLFTCSQKLDESGVGFKYNTTPGADPFRRNPINKEHECGFGVEHQEMINMPAIGRMVFIGARYHIQ
ncbi:hypothetical protein BH23GEM7_BH23GEM7_33040 [soil metagenome]